MHGSTTGLSLNCIRSRAIASKQCVPFLSTLRCAPSSRTNKNSAKRNHPHTSSRTACCPAILHSSISEWVSKWTNERTNISSIYSVAVYVVFRKTAGAFQCIKHFGMIQLCKKLIELHWRLTASVYIQCAKSISIRKKKQIDNTMNLSPKNHTINWVRKME